MKKQKIILTITLILAMLLIQTSPILNKVKAETITGSEGNVSWTFDSDTGTLTFSGSGKITDSWKDDVTEYKTGVSTVVINDGITSIGDWAFEDCDSLTSIAIPDSVTRIEMNAFKNCDSLITITIPDSVESIVTDAFYNCNSLTSITVDSNNANYSDIDGILFNKDKTNLICYPEGKKDTSYVIPDSVESIVTDAFYDCDNLTSITIPDSVTSIGDCAFDNCDNLTSITIPDSVISIGVLTFGNCKSLTSITIPDSVTSIGNRAFDNCYSLTSVTISGSVTSIGDNAFNNCHSLTNITVDSNNAKYSDIDGILFNKDKTELICYPRKKKDTSYTIPNSVTSIGDYAFDGCHNLTSITIPDNAESIGDNAFWNCDKLTSITIPDSVTSIGDNAFTCCYSLTSITVDSNNAKYSDIDGILFNKDKTNLICYPEGKKDTSYVIPDSVESIGYEAFYDCDNLTSITIPDSVTSIGDRAFRSCNNLTSITIPDSVTSIGDRAFDYCNNLTIYCQSNSTAETYAIDNKIDYVIDDDGPTVKLALDNSYIVVTASDSGVGLADEAYSIDGTNWYENNKIAVDKSGEYTVYVRDKLGNTSQEKITVDFDEPTITNIAVDGYKITVTATDNIALADEAYSIDGTNYQASNVFTVSKAGTYTIYVKDSSNNVSTKSVTVEDKKDDGENEKDTEAPNITNISVDGYKITVMATDNIALADEAYSIDGTNYQASNVFTVSKAGTYTIYVKDSSNNITTKSVTVNDVTDDDDNKKKDDTTDNNDNKKTDDTADNNNNKNTETNSDTEAPTITEVKVDGYKITVTATDNVGLADKAYSIDGENWQASNEFTVTQTGRYMVYVKDSSGNIAKKIAIVSSTTNNNQSSSEESETQSTDTNDSSKSTSKLPQTGGKSIIIGIIAILVCAGFFRRKMKKTGI